MEARTTSSQRGMSLIEATIILMVLAALTAVAAPSIGGYREDARQVVAKKEAETIASAILQMLRDTGSRCLRLVGTTDCTVTNRVDLLVTSGVSPRGIDTALAPDVVLPDSEAATASTVNWLPSGNAPIQQDLLEDQLIENDNATPYPTVSFPSGGGPRMKLGWRGAYLNGPITADPWHARYQVNTMFLTVATNAFDTAGSPNQLQEGLRETGWNRDVLVLSAGNNGIVETSFGGTATGGVSAGGDDVIYVMRGGSR
jgi:type II secretory pathway pseudopilin PulG